MASLRVSLRPWGVNNKSDTDSGYPTSPVSSPVLTPTSPALSSSPLPSRCHTPPLFPELDELGRLGCSFEDGHTTSHDQNVIFDDRTATGITSDAAAAAAAADAGLAVSVDDEGESELDEEDDSGAILEEDMARAVAVLVAEQHSFKVREERGAEVVVQTIGTESEDTSVLERVSEGSRTSRQSDLKAARPRRNTSKKAAIEPFACRSRIRPFPTSSARIIRSRTPSPFRRSPSPASPSPAPSEAPSPSPDPSDDSSYAASVQVPAPSRKFRPCRPGGVKSTPTCSSTPGTKTKRVRVYKPRSGPARQDQNKIAQKRYRDKVKDASRAAFRFAENVADAASKPRFTTSTVLRLLKQMNDEMMEIDPSKVVSLRVE